MPRVQVACSGYWMFYIIGVNHRFQSLKAGETPTPEHLFYQNTLSDVIVTRKPTLVAEEESRETLRGRTSIAEGLANKLQVEHVLCDPNKTQRQSIGYRCLVDLQTKIYQENQDISDHDCEVRATAIETAREFGKREDYWLKSIEGRNLSKVIFVCGAAHIDGLRKRLSERGVQSEVIVRAIGITREQQELIAEAELLLKEDPNIDVA